MWTIWYKPSPVLLLHNVPIHMKLSAYPREIMQTGAPFIPASLLSYQSPKLLDSSNVTTLPVKVVQFPRAGQADALGFERVVGVEDRLAAGVSRRHSRPRKKRSIARRAA